VSSIRHKGALIKVFPQDHEPRHVHVTVAEVTVIVNLMEDGTVEIAARPDAVRPANGQRNHIREALNLIAECFEEAAALWERMHK
jgi:hypothetical protein